MTIVIFILLVVAGQSVISAAESCPGLPMCFCNKAKTSVNCEGKGLTDVPENIPETVVKLYLGYNQISTIGTRAFSSFSKLEELYLQRSKIIKIEPYAFANCSSLVQIDLRENILVSIGENAFSDMKSLETLYLLTNHIDHFEESVFVGTETLADIYLQSNYLTAVPDLGYLPNLQMLVLEGNNILNATFPSSFRSAKKPIYVGLSNNKITSLDNNTFESLRNKSVSSLYLSRNKLENIDPGTFTPLGSITSLKLGTNPLHPAALRTAIESLKGKSMASLDISGIQLNGVLLENTFELLRNTSITTLNMRYNKLQTLPNIVFSGLNKLLHLDLTSCEIQQTSTNSFVGLDKLTILILNNNKLITVPKNLPNTLVYLYLDDNQLTNVSNKAFSNLAYLRELRLRYNKILTLEQDAFFGLVQLNKLSLYDNNIAILPGKVFAPLVRLISLDLEKNNLATVQNAKDRFSSLGSLLYLNLANNKMTYIQSDIFKYTISLRYLHLEHNLLGKLIARNFDGSLFMGLSKLQELYLMDNQLSTVPDAMFQDLSSLKFLNLTSNQVTTWGPNLFRPTQYLQVLDLTNNLIATFREEQIHDLAQSLRSLNLTGNPFACNCDLRWFRDWMNQTSVELANSASYRCNGPDRWAGKPLLSFDRSKIDCLIIKWWYILIASAVVLIVVVIMSGVIYRKRWWLKLFIYKQSRRSKKTRKLNAADGRGGYGAIEPEDAVKKFDAYISCAEEDKKWVLTYLLPGVDNGKIDDERVFGGQYSLYFEERDAVVGRSLAGNIFENLSCSRKMLVVLSKDYLDAMHMFEFDLATNMMYEGKLEEIVIIHIEKGLPEKKLPKELSHTMKRNKVVEWSEDVNAQEHFRRRINDILGKKTVANEYETE